MTKLLWNASTGEAQVFDDEAQPEGFIDHHPNDPDKGTPAKAPKKNDPPSHQGGNSGDNDPDKAKHAQLSMTKDQMISALKAGNIEFDPKAKAAELDELLHSKLREALTAAGKEIPEGTTTAGLWDLVRQK